MRFTALYDKHNPWAGGLHHAASVSLNPSIVADSRERHMDYRLQNTTWREREARAAQGWMLFGFHLSVSPGKRGDDRSIPELCWEHKSKRCYRESDWRVISSVSEPDSILEDRGTSGNCLFGILLLVMVIIASPYWRLTLSQTLLQMYSL